MATSDDVVEQLISRLALPLEPPARVAFRAAALDALMRVPCLGEGAIYRAVASLQRQFWDPPDDQRIGQTRGSGLRRPSKPIDAPALGEDSARCGERARNAFRAA